MERKTNMKKKIILTALAAILLLMLPLVSEAAVIDSGSCGDHVTYSFDDSGILVISGSGEITQKPWADSAYIDDVRKIEIKNGVTGIEFKAFDNFRNVTSVSLPDTIVNIEGWAFSNWSSLSNITIPDGVTRIEGCTFYNCKQTMNN